MCKVLFFKFYIKISLTHTYLISKYSGRSLYTIILTWLIKAVIIEKSRSEVSHRQESQPFSPNSAQISIPVPWKSPTAGLLYNDFECCFGVQKNQPRKAELAWQVSRYPWRGSLNYKIKIFRPLFPMIFRSKMVISRLKI